MNRPRSLPSPPLPLWVLALLSLVSQGQAQTARIMGSDLLDPWFPRWVASQPQDVNAAAFTFQLRGSHSGWIALREGYADAFFQLQSRNPLPLEDPLKSALIGYYVLYVYAPHDFPDSHIALESLTQIASPRQTAATLTWRSLLESPGAWAEGSTRILVAPGPHGIAQSLFRVAVESTDSLSTNAVHYVETEEVLLEQVREHRHFLLISDHPMPPEATLKPVPVRGFNELVAFSATPENIRFGDYPLTFPLHYLYLSHHTGAKQMLKLLQTLPAQTAFSDHHILPAIPENPER